VAAPVDTPKILLVDDRQENLLALTAVLSPLEVELVTASSGEQALRSMLQDDFAAVLLDVQMPDMDGFETAAYIRSRPRSRTTPIIFVTAFSQDVEHVLRGYEAGAVDYVLKPFDPAVLRSKVAVFAELERERRGRARSEALLRGALESSPSGAAIADADGIVLRANPALGALLGRPPDRLTGRRIEELLAGAGADGFVRRLEGLKTSGGPPFATELTLRGARGEELPVAAVASTVGHGNSAAEHLFIQLWDLSDRVAAEHARQLVVAERAARAEAESLAQRLANVAAITDGLEAMRISGLAAELCRRLAEVLGVDGAIVKVLPPDQRRPAQAEVGELGQARQALAEALVGGTTATAGWSIAVALRAEEGIAGAIAVNGVGDEASDPRVSLLAHAAERIALVLERVRIYEREHHIASTLQRDLLPHRLPDVPGLTLAAHFHAGGDGTQVGGDWYDAIALPGGRLGLVVGDVAGRGVGAAARMGQLRSVARAYAMEGHPPAVVVQRMNLYHRGLSPDDLTTLVYAVVEPDLRRLRMANAGHPPPALLVPGQEPRLVEGSAAALGVSDMVHVEEQVVEVPPGAVLLLYTDGLVERRGEGIDDGLARMTQALGASERDLGEIQRNVLGACLDDGSGDDDVTALLVRVEPELGSRVRFTLTPDADTLAALRRTLRRWLQEAGAEPGDVAAMTMAANEAWQNTIEHAHGFAPVPVDVEFELRGDEAIITTRDAGNGRSSGWQDPDRGRGIELMRALTDEAALEFGGPTHGGCVVLRRRIMEAPLSART